MELGSPLFSVCRIIMICLLGAAHRSNGVDINCPCAEIPQRLGTEPPPQNCFKTSFRYTCNRGFLRKAGTSNLIKCKQIEGTPQWYPPIISLQCIRDPNIATTQPPISPVTLNTNCPCPKIPLWPETKTPPENCSNINDTFRYTCTRGYVRKAGTSDLIKCNGTGGTPQWSSPSLKCILDPNVTPTQPPNSPVTQGYTDIPRDSTFTTTVTAASSSLQTTQTISPSASVTAETETEADRTETTSPGLRTLSGLSQAEKVNATENNATQQTGSNSTTSEPSDPNTDPYVFHPVATVIGCASLMIICALIGITVFCYRRRSKNAIPTLRPEERTPMNHGPPEEEL